MTAVRLFDPLEMDLPDIGLVTMKDVETGEQIVVDTHNRRFRERFAAAAEQRETALREALARAGVDTLELGTDDDLVDAVLRFADLRSSAGGSQLGGTAPATGGRGLPLRDATPGRLALHDLPLALDAVAAARRPAAGRRAMSSSCARRKQTHLRYANLALVKEALGGPQRLAPPHPAGAALRRPTAALLFAVVAAGDA